MKHGILAVLLAMLTKPAVHRGFAVARLGDGLARLSKSVWLLVNLSTSLVMAQFFMSAQMRPLLRAEPRLMFKFLGNYLATDLSRKERAAMLIDHYAFLKERVREDFFPLIIDRRLELWQ